MPALPLLLLRFKRLISTAGRESLILYYACRHPATPRSVKVIAILMAIYLVSPVDAITDLLPLLGWVDDFAVLAIGLPWLLRRVPPRVVVEATARADALLSKRPGWRGAAGGKGGGSARAKAGRAAPRGRS